MRNRNLTDSPYKLLIVIGLSFFILGCDQGSGIRTYKVAKKPSSGQVALAAKETGQEQQIFGAIVPQGKNAWYFKLKGEPEKVGGIQEEFKSIVNSATFESAGPKVKLASGWSEKGASGIAYTTLHHDEAGLTATVTPLFAGEALGDSSLWQNYVLQNVNRWRGQLSLPDTTWPEIEPALEESQELSQGPARAYFVSIVGRESGGGMGGAPFMRGGPFSGGNSAPTASGPNPGLEPPAKPSLMYSEPEGWIAKDVSSSQMRLASFDISQGDATAEITVLPLSGATSQHLKIWLGQVNAETTDEAIARVEESSEDVSVNEIDSLIYHFDGSDTEVQKSLTIVEIPWRTGENLFVKILGDAELVNSQRANLSEFLESVVW